VTETPPTRIFKGVFHGRKMMKHFVVRISLLTSCQINSSTSALLNTEA
jgi:hypothetical protein